MPPACGFESHYPHQIQKAPLRVLFVFLKKSSYGLGFVLGHQEVGDDGVGDQVALGGQVPAALVVDTHIAQAAVVCQNLHQGLEGQQEQPLVFVGGDALLGAQAEHQVFARPLPQGDLLHVLHDLAAVPDALDVGLDVPGQGEPLAGKVGAGTGAEAQVFPASPVFHIVAGILALAAEVGNLVLPVAPGPQQLHGGKVHIRLQVVVGQVRRFLVVPQGRALLDFQAIAADVLGQEL